MNRLVKKFLSLQDGSCEVVEAVFIYPVVILSVTLMIYIGIYVLEYSMLQYRAGSTAVYTSRCLAFPGYDKAARSEGVSNMMRWYEGQAQAGEISDAYRVVKPYRYILSDSDTQNNENNLKVYAQDMFLFSDDIVCCIDCSERYISGRKITVTLERKIPLPQIFDLLSFNTHRTMHVRACSIVSDNAEFIRNTDLTADCLGALSEKYSLNSKLGSMMERISDALGWLEVDDEDDNS
ncbi:MAG: hypothetical protein Q4F95_15435 [Oscillospiraceae bacterium]|nr:hypothetical protein [Oscillospiraceae bacterium]